MELLSVTSHALYEQLRKRSLGNRLFFEDKDLAGKDLFQEAYFLGKEWIKQGVSAKDVIAVCGNKQWMLRAFLAALSIEAIFCPVAPHWKAYSLPLVSGSSRVWWHCEGEDFKSLEGSYKPWDFLASMHAPAILLRTSASLSQGKWVGYEASNVLNQLRMHDEALPLLSLFRLQLLPLYHTFGLVLDTLMGLYRGQDLLFIEMGSTSGGQWLELLPTVKWDMALTPRLAYIASRFMKAKKATLGMLHVGGAPFTETCRRLCERVFEKVIEGYGLTECGPGILLEKKPLEDIELRLENAQQGVGVLWMKTPMIGVWQNQDSQLVNGWFCSQDLAYCDRGEWKILGRVDRFFKQTDGRWCSLDELEHQICERFQLLAVKVDSHVLGGYVLQLLEGEIAKATGAKRFLEERTGLSAFIQPVCEDKLLQKTTKAFL